jgi:hypothetical protein
MEGRRRCRLPARFQDEFAEKSLGLRIGMVFGPVHTVGLGLATVCVFSGL